MNSSPWARLITPRTPKMNHRPNATRIRIPARLSPFRPWTRTCCIAAAAWRSARRAGAALLDGFDLGKRLYDLVPLPGRAAAGCCDHRDVVVQVGALRRPVALGVERVDHVGLCPLHLAQGS